MSIHNVDSAQYKCSLHFVFQNVLELSIGKLVVVWHYIFWSPVRLSVHRHLFRVARYLITYWRDVSETSHTYSPCKVELLKKFARSEVKRLGHVCTECVNAVTAEEYISTVTWRRGSYSANSAFVVLYEPITISSSESTCGIHGAI